MGITLALLRREAREIRALTIAMALIAPVALVAYEEFLGHYSYGHYTARFGVPGLVALFAAIVASDLVAAEVATRRIDALVALPVTLRRIWCTKVALLLTATLSFAGWVWGAAALLYSLRTTGANAHAFFGNATDLVFGCSAALPLGLSVLFFSTLLPRGFAAALGGAITMGAATAGPASVDWKAWEIDAGDAITIAVPVALAALLAVGSFLAFTRGPIHAGGTLRKSLLAFAIPLGLLVPGTAVAWAAVHAHVALEPGDPDVEIDDLLVSPGGDHVALTVRKAGQKRHRAWIVSLTSGATRVLADGPAVVTAWSDETTCVMIQGTLVRWVDATTTRAVRARSQAQVIAETGGDPAAGAVHAESQWWTTRVQTFDRGTGIWTTTIESPRGRYVLEGAGPTDLSSRAGHVVFTPEPGVLVHRNLFTGQDVLRLSSPGGISGRASPDGRYIHTFEQADRVTTYRVRDAENGEDVTPSVQRRDNAGASIYQPGRNVSGWIYVYGDDDAHLRCLATGARLQLSHRQWPAPRCAELPDGRLLIARNGGLDVVETDGTVSRTHMR